MDEEEEREQASKKVDNQMGGRALFFLTIPFAIQLCSIQLRTPLEERIDNNHMTELHEIWTGGVLTGNPLSGSGIRSARKMTPAHPKYMANFVAGLLSFFLLNPLLSASPSIQYCAFIQYSAFTTHRSALLHPSIQYTALSLQYFHSALSFSALSFSHRR